MTYVDNKNVDCTVQAIYDLIGPIGGVIKDEMQEDFKDKIRGAIGQYLGIRTEDGQDRLYDVILLDGEPYVMDE